MQKTLLIGYLGKDPEMKYTAGGTALFWSCHSLVFLNSLEFINLFNLRIGLASRFEPIARSEIGMLTNDGAHHC